MNLLRPIWKLFNN